MSEATSVQPPDVLRRVIEIFPAFKLQWHSPDNCFREVDGSFTYCGIFAELSAYCRDGAGALSDNSLAGLAALLSECMDGTNFALEEAAATCFLENIAGELISVRLKPLLTGEPLRFFSQTSD